MRRSWQTHFLELISGKNNSPLFTLLRALLIIPSWIYRWVVSCRNWAFNQGYLSVYTSEVPLVISVGNIVVGGTGKTPTTLMLAQTFGPEVNIAILTRGYRSRAETLPVPIVLSRGKGPVYGANYCGDEPYLLAKRLPNTTVIVGKDRCAASKIAAKEGAKLILLDDGMQHRRLARHFDVIVIDALNPFGHGYLLPRGMLREPIHALSRAHFIVLTHVKDQEHYQKVSSLLKPYTSAPMVGTKLEVEHIWHTQKGKIDSLDQRKAGIFCGIAHPERFMQTVQSLEVEVVSHCYFPDHFPFDQQTIEQFARSCLKKGAEMIICTEKDYVKLKGCFFNALPIVWLEMRTAIVFGEEHWNAFIEQAKAKLNRGNDR